MKIQFCITFIFCCLFEKLQLVYFSLKLCTSYTPKKISRLTKCKPFIGFEWEWRGTIIFQQEKFIFLKPFLLVFNASSSWCSLELHLQNIFNVKWIFKVWFALRKQRNIYIFERASRDEKKLCDVFVFLIDRDNESSKMWILEEMNEKIEKFP